MLTATETHTDYEAMDYDIFHQWLDSLEQNSKNDFEFATIGWPLECLAHCEDTLPPHCCDRLEITKGSTYSEAITELRRMYAQRHAEDRGGFIGRETWWCDGMPVTPAMRSEVLCEVASSFEEHGHLHYGWREHEESSRFLRLGQVVLTEETPRHETLEDFFAELTGEVDRHDGYLRSYEDDFHEWLRRDYFPEKWKQNSDWINTDYDGNWKAAHRIFKWLERLRCDDVTAWYSSQQSREEALR